MLVVDLHTTRILSSACRMYDVMEAGVVVMENLKLTREKLVTAHRTCSLIEYHSAL